MSRPAITALGLLAMTTLSSAETVCSVANIGEAVLPTAFADNRPAGIGATVTAVSGPRPLHLRAAALSTFIVEYAPGGSAVLHRAPAAGYVIVYVLSGSIQASAWNANVGVYRAGKTWVVPAFAYNITTKNANSDEPARALVVLATAADRPDAAKLQPDDLETGVAAR